MNAIALARACNDADIVEAFVRHHAALVDLLVVVDEGSRDGTRAILEALRHEGLPLVIVDDPAIGGAPEARLTKAYRMVAPVLDPELVWLLEIGQFVRGERTDVETELANLPVGACAVLRHAIHVPDAATAARATLADPLAMIADRRAADEPGECHAVLRRDRAADATLTLEAIGRALRVAGEPLPAYLCERATLACFPVRGVAQLGARILHDWAAHRARHVGDAGARQRFAARALLDRVLAGLAIAPETVVDIARGASEAALVRDPVPHAYTTLRYLHLVDHAALKPVLAGTRWPQEHPDAVSVAGGERLDLAPTLDLCAALGATSAIVMAGSSWTNALAAVRPSLVQHTPRDGEPTPAVDLLLIPETPAGLADEIAGVCDPAAIARIALWPAEHRPAGTLAAELARWQAAGWEPDMMRTLAFRALSSYGTGRRGALVLGPVDAQRPERSRAIVDTLVALDAVAPAWIDPPTALILHPLQSVGLVVPVAAPAPDAGEIAHAAPPAPPKARSVLILGAGRSGTSCLAGMFDAATHHHARDLYGPQVSNPKGFFEAGYVNDLNESMMLASAVAHLGADATRTLLQGFEPHQLWLARFPDAMPAAWNEQHRRLVADAVKDTPFVLKDPRMAITAPAWLEAAPDALILSIHRAPDITAESILKECRVATYLLDFRISMKDAFEVWRQAYRRALRLYRAGRDVLFLRYDDLFDEARLGALEGHVRAPLRRDFAEKHLNRTKPFLKVPDECAALDALLDELAVLTFAGRRAEAEAAIDRHLGRWPDRALAPVPAPAAA